MIRFMCLMNTCVMLTQLHDQVHVSDEHLCDVNTAS